MKKLPFFLIILPFIVCSCEKIQPSDEWVIKTVEYNSLPEAVVLPDIPPNKDIKVLIKYNKKTGETFTFEQCPMIASKGKAISPHSRGWKKIPDDYDTEKKKNDEKWQTYKDNQPKEN
jgi:hypothetical protein